MLTKLSRHLARVIATQSIYEWDFRKDEDNFKETPEEIAKRNIKAIAPGTDPTFVNLLVETAMKNLPQIDEKIAQAAPEWPIEQIAMIDKNILRIALGELLFSDEVPPKVAINEAIELGKTFGGENSSKFINGVLGTIYRGSEKYNPEDDENRDK